MSQKPARTKRTALRTYEQLYEAIEMCARAQKWSAAKWIEHCCFTTTIAALKDAKMTTEAKSLESLSEEP